MDTLTTIEVTDDVSVTIKVDTDNGLSIRHMIWKAHETLEKVMQERDIRPDELAAMETNDGFPVPIDMYREVH